MHAHLEGAKEERKGARGGAEQEAKARGAREQQATRREQAEKRRAEREPEQGAQWEDGLQLEERKQRQGAPQVGHLVLVQVTLDGEDAPDHRKSRLRRAQEWQPAQRKRRQHCESQL